MLPQKLSEMNRFNKIKVLKLKLKTENIRIKTNSKY